LNSGVNDRRARGCLRSMVSMMDILSGAMPLMGDVRQSGSGPLRLSSLWDICSATLASADQLRLTN
jgi:hypothetical protein